MDFAIKKMKSVLISRKVNELFLKIAFFLNKFAQLLFSQNIIDQLEAKKVKSCNDNFILF